MSIEADVLLQEAKESIEAAQNYRSELQQRLQGLTQARKQVRGSALQTREVLRQHFQELQASLGRLLDERLAALLLEVDAIETDSVRPLDDCQKLIEQGVSAAEELLREGEAALRCGVNEKDDKLGSFTKKALQIQLDSLPEVPSLVDVPCLSAQLDDSLLPGVRDRIFSHGSVASHPPVQIDELVERPGGILVRWCKVDEDFVVQDYRLQYRRGALGQYEDAYVGRDTESIVLQLDSHTEYLFRVCARGEGRREWSPCAVYVNGKEMTNQLPAVSVGSSVTFDMEVVGLFPVNNNNVSEGGGGFKLRVTIGSGNREVVFDWLLDQSVDSLFFGCSFTYPGWKVLVF
ncbi:CRLF3 factor, partial [Amia calva]|nr:CRLF3 factor [Amia calva]